MNIYKITKNSKIPSSNLPLIIGGFEVIHKGHIKLFKTKPFNVLLVVSIPHKKQQITSVKTRIKNIKTLGTKAVYVIDLKKNNLNSSSFEKKVLNQINPKKIIIGSNFRYGKKLNGNINTIKECFSTTVIKTDLNYRATFVKEWYKKGDVHKANQLLHIPLYLEGKIVKGKQMGRKLNAPTLNFYLDNKNHAPIKDGVYAATAIYKNNEYKTALFISKFMRKKQLFEAHIIEEFKYKIDKENYGKQIKVNLIKRVNDLTKCNSTNELKKVIKNNIFLVKQAI